MLNSFLLSAVAIFVALDIVGTLPLYLSITRDMSARARKQTANTSMWVALVVAVVFIFIGKPLFRWLGIEMHDFRIAGGIILLLVSLADLLGGPEFIQRSSGSTGVVPLAVPLITGPAVLATVLLQAGSVGYSITLASLFANYALAWFLLRRADLVTRVIGKDGTVVVSKLAALILAAIAVSMVRGGIADAIRGG